MLHAKLKARDAGHTLEDTVDDGNKETYTSQLEATFPALIDGSHLSVEKPKEDGADVGEEREDAAAAAAEEEEELDNDNNKNNNNNSGDASEDDDDDDMPIRGSHHRARKSGSPPTEEELKEAVFEIIVRVKEGGGKRISTKEVRKELEKKFGCSLKAYKEKIQDCIYFKVIDRDTTIVRKKRNNSRKEGSRLKRKRELKTEQDVKDDVRETEGVAEEEVKEEEREVKKRPQRKKKVKKLRKSNPLRYADSDASSSDDDDEDDDEEEGEEEEEEEEELNDGDDSDDDNENENEMDDKESKSVEKPHKERKTPASIFSNTGVYSVPGKVRWQRTTAQLERLEQLFANDTTTPRGEKLKQVTEELSAIAPFKSATCLIGFRIRNRD